MFSPGFDAQTYPAGTTAPKKYRFLNSSGMFLGGVWEIFFDDLLGGFRDTCWEIFLRILSGFWIVLGKGFRG